MTPEQAAVFMQMQQNQQANNAATWQGMQQNPLFQRMPTTPQYQYQPPVYQAPVYQPQRNINCNSFINGQYVTTNCR